MARTILPAEPFICSDDESHRPRDVLRTDCLFSPRTDTNLAIFSRMAKKTVVEYVDDLDGKPVHIDQLHTIEWSWLGVDYVIDTSATNLEKIENGRVPVSTLLSKSARVGGRRRSSAPKHHTNGRQGPVVGADERTSIRQWAREQGYDIGDRGRISQQITAAYREQSDGR